MATRIRAGDERAAGAEGATERREGRDRQSGEPAQVGEPAARGHRGSTGRHAAADDEGAAGDAADGEDPCRATSGWRDGQCRGEEGKHGGDRRGRGPGESEVDREPRPAARGFRQEERGDGEAEQPGRDGETGERDPPVVRS